MTAKASSSTLRGKAGGTGHGHSVLRRDAHGEAAQR